MQADSIIHRRGESEIADGETTDLKDSPSNSGNAAFRKDHASFGDMEADGLVIEGSTSYPPNDWVQTIAGVAGNILEWYDFAVFGSLGDVIGEVFFPAQAGDAALVESFVVFGGAFLMRPVGGLLLGYIGDKYGRKRALVLSIFLMAFPTTAMGLLPGYKQVGPLAIILLVIVRLIQGISVGGQLMSSLVFTLEGHDQRKWGFYGSFVMAAANFGTLLGNIVGTVIRDSLSQDQLLSFGWRIPFVFGGLIITLSGCFLKSHGDEIHATHAPLQTSDDSEERGEVDVVLEEPVNPVSLAFSKENRSSLLAASMVPMLWSGGFYLSFVWMSIYTDELLDEPLPHGFAVNCVALFVSVCLLFPYAGILSDRHGRKRIMSIGGILMGVLSPILIVIIGLGNPILAFFAQSLLGIGLSLWGSPMLAWLVEAFEPEARLTSVAIGYNIAQALAGGLSPALATVMVDSLGPNSPGWLITAFAAIAMTGLWYVAPTSPPHLHAEKVHETEMVLAGDRDML